MHETGHMFSMRHCTKYECLMSGTNHMGETDRRPLEPFFRFSLRPQHAGRPIRDGLVHRRLVTDLLQEAEIVGAIVPHQRRAGRLVARKELESRATPHLAAARCHRQRAARAAVDGEGLDGLARALADMVDLKSPFLLGLVVELATRRRIFVPMLRVTSIEPGLNAQLSIS